MFRNFCVDKSFILFNYLLVFCLCLIDVENLFEDDLRKIIIIIIIINCNWVVTRWQWLFYMCTKHEIGYY